MGLTELLRSFIPDIIWNHVPTVLVIIVVLWILKTILGKLMDKISKQRMIKRWSKTTQDVVVLHCLPTAKNSPNGSPFVVKLETYLKMANIPYEVDVKDFFGMKGKTPWITLNGEHIADSQMCIEFLAKKFGKKIGNGNYSKEERALANLARITMDEHFIWGLLLWRYIYTKGKDCLKFMPFPPLILKYLLMTFVPQLKKAVHGQGIGRHSQDEVVKIMCDDLRTISTFLGDKKFLLGDEPCEEDAAVFGHLAEIVWNCPNSPYEKLVYEELGNIKDYCMRMQKTYWPEKEWINCAGKKLVDSMA